MTKLSIVTGGSKGIGKFLIQSLLYRGPVLNISRTPAALNPSSEFPHKLYNLSLEFSDIKLLEACLKSWLSDHPEYSVSLFVSNAATLSLGWLGNLSLEDFEKTFAVNTYAPISISSILSILGKFDSDGARIIYVTSSLARNIELLSFAGIGLYSATKAALSRLATIQRREFFLQHPKITVTQIHPGIVATSMQNNLRNNDDIDPAFASKTASLPSYRDGDWEIENPVDKMRTISARFAADFIFWVSQLSDSELANEYDFYASTEFHKIRRQHRTGN